MVRAAGLGFLAAAVDCRYHGGRAAPQAVTPYEGYQDALVRCTNATDTIFGPRRPPKVLR